jgi:hypothetical protein
MQGMPHMVQYRTRQVRIPIVEFIEDIRQGMADHDLMTKYSIRNQKTLLTAFDKLMESGRVTREELYNRSPFINTQAIADFLGSTRAIDELD